MLSPFLFNEKEDSATALSPWIGYAITSARSRSSQHARR